MKSTDPRHGYAYQKLRAAFVRSQTTGTPCSLCGRPIDTTLSGRLPWGPTVEHTVPVRERPDLALDVAHWRLAHRRCQSQQGAHATNGTASAGRSPDPRVRPSRAW